MYKNDLAIVSPILTNIALGHSNATFVANRLLPEVRVQSQTGNIMKWGKDSFLTYNTLRAPRGDNNIVDPSFATTIGYVCDEHSLTTPLDIKQEINVAADPQQLKFANTKKLRNNLLLSLEYDKLTYLQDTNNYGASNKTTLLDDFLNEDAVNPILYLKTKMDYLASNMIGLLPNLMVCNYKVLSYILNNPKTRAYFTNNTPADVIPTKESVAKLLGLSEIIVANAKYSTNKSTFLDIWGNKILLLYSSTPTGTESASEFLPNFGYTLLYQSVYVDTFQNPGNTIEYIRCTEVSTYKITGSDAGYLITNPIDPTVYSA